MRNRALVVRSISACRRGGRSPMEECAASLRRRSSTQASAHLSTARIMLMSSCPVPSLLIRSASRAARGAPRLERITLVATTPHREVPAWCSQQDLVRCRVAHCFALLRGCIWRETDGPSAWSVNFERLPLELRRERHRHEWSHSRCDGPAICRTQGRRQQL